MTVTAKQEESVAAAGARWLAIAMVTVGLLNYGNSLLLTHLLSVTEFSRFVAGQGLILWATNIATVSVPWVLAQAMVRARSDEEQASAIRFAKLASAVSGLIAAVVVGTIATRFAGISAALAVAISTMVIFLGTTSTGWLQGRQRMRALSALFITETLLKNAAGLLLVLVAGLGDTGALAAFGVGALAMLVRWPRTPRGTSGAWRATLVDRGLWRRAVAMAGAQGVVSLFIAINVVMVALLPGGRALAASYQASATLSRIPLYVAGAVAGAFFPLLSRSSDGSVIAARAVRMYAAVALPLAAVLATIPAPLLALVFPTQYGAVATLLKYTAVTGLAAGGISLITAFFQAGNDYSCLRWLGAGLAGYMAGLLAGWRADGIVGLAAGGALGATVAFAVIVYRLVRRHGSGVLARVPVAEPAAAAVVLIILRPVPILWLVVASVVGLRAAVRFVRPGARHRRDPRWAAPRAQKPERTTAMSLLIDAVWRGTAREATEADLHQVLGLSRLNRVEGRLAHAYPEQLADVLAEVRVAGQLYTRNLHQAIDHLDHAAVLAVLIRDDMRGDHVHPSIDLVVSEQDWRGAVAALARWSEYCVLDEEERQTRALFHPITGPVVYLHTGPSWLGAPVLPASQLLARARRNADGVREPGPADYLRIRVARAFYRDLALDLSLLLAVRNLMRPEVFTAARSRASREGWLASFDDVLAAATNAIADLDRGLQVSFPLPLPAASNEDPAARRLNGDNSNGDSPSSRAYSFRTAQQNKSLHTFRAFSSSEL